MPARSPLEALLARGDDQAFAYLTGCLADCREIDPSEAPPATPPRAGDARERQRVEMAEVEG